MSKTVTKEGYTPTIGLEVHAELKTKTKMFCACLNDPDEKTPNINICPVCMAHPGALPVINEAAVLKVLTVGKALSGTLAIDTEFDRKNYFYPDIPKGYQISQYERPLVKGGVLAGVAVTRVHLEEDTARSQHPSTGSEQVSLVDFNRAGVPLMELVTEPVIHDSKTAGAFARELQLLLRTLDVGEANMEKGEMRVEANISVGKGGVLGTKVEIKNLNSFRSVERAIQYEIERQTALLEKGEKIEQETRGWDEVAEKTFSQRKKESSHDYRYFPDPDLPPLRMSEISNFKNIETPELPSQKRARLLALGFLQEQDVEQLVGDAELSHLFTQVEQMLTESTQLKIAANFILNDIAGQKAKDTKWSMPDAAFLAEVVSKYEKGILASPQAKQAILNKKIVSVLDSNEIPALVQKIITAHPTVVTDYKSGKESALQFLVGQGMKESKGSANPEALREAIKGAIEKI